MTKTERLVRKFRVMQPISGKSIKIGIGHAQAIRHALKRTGLFADIIKTGDMTCNHQGHYVPVYLVTFWLLSGCAFFDGFHSGKSEPAYPPYIADQPVLWTEGGQTSLIDRTGVHPLK